MDDFRGGENAPYFFLFNNQFLEQGLEKGIEQGIEQGIDLGVDKGIKAIAKNMKIKGFNVSEIIEITGLSEQEIEKL